MPPVLNGPISAFLLVAISFVLPPLLRAQVRVPAPNTGANAPNAQSQSVQNHTITVSGGGEAHVKPDLGILIMSIRSTSPIADEAVAENGRKAKNVEAALAGAGIAPAGYQISSVTFAQPGGPRFPGQPEISVYEATQYVYVFFEGADLNDVAELTQKSAAIIEALRKAGAVPANSGFPMGPIGPAAAQGALIIYTIKDPTQYEH